MERAHAQRWAAHEESVIVPRTNTKKKCFFVVVRGEMEKRTTTRHMKVTEARVHMRREAAMCAELRVRMRRHGARTRNLSFSRALPQKKYFFCGSARGNGKMHDRAGHEGNRGARAHAQRSGDACRAARTHAQRWRRQSSHLGIIKLSRGAITPRVEKEWRKAEFTPRDN